MKTVVTTTSPSLDDWKGRRRCRRTLSAVFLLIVAATATLSVVNAGSTTTFVTRATITTQADDCHKVRLRCQNSIRTSSSSTSNRWVAPSSSNDVAFAFQYSKTIRPCIRRTQLLCAVKHEKKTLADLKSRYDTIKKKKKKKRKKTKRQLWYTLRRFIRACLQRSTVYVLECADNTYYIGSTRNKRQRYREHFDRGGGSAWTTLHKPIRVVREYRRIPQRHVLGMESQMTAQYMVAYGVHHVRGGMFCETKPFTSNDIPMLTSFLGHYNNLRYSAVHQQLQHDLAPSKQVKSAAAAKALHRQTQRAAKKERKLRRLRVAKAEQKIRNRVVQEQKRARNKCKICGVVGHWKNECPNKTTAAAVMKSTTTKGNSNVNTTTKPNNNNATTVTVAKNNNTTVMMMKDDDDILIRNGKKHTQNNTDDATVSTKEEHSSTAAAAEGVSKYYK